MTCPYADWDAAYVLGALDPADVVVFETHLTGCTECRSAVGELAPMPGLLAHATADPPALPGNMLPELLRRVRSHRRNARIRQAVAVVATAAAAAVIVAVSPLGTPPTALPLAAGTPIELVAAPGVPVRATVSLTSTAWGTSVETRCRYTGQEPSQPGTGDPVRYDLYAIDDAGVATLVSSWQSWSGQDVDVPGGTRLTAADIDRFEIRLASGRTVLSGG